VLLRAVRAHLLPSSATFVLSLVVSAGAVGVVGASRVGGAPAAVATMLALYGGVALAEQSARNVLDRSHDLALARLRGLSGGRLVAFAAGPLLALSLVGVAAGSVVGGWLAGRVAAGWGVSYTLATREVVVALAILGGAWLTIGTVAAAVIRRPLVEVLSVHPRRRATAWVTTFLELLLVAAACLAVYEAHRSESGWVATIAPALVALGAGQLVMWALALTPHLGHRLGLTLTSRRLRRDPDPGSVVRVLVAAAVLLAVTLTGGRAAAQWRHDAGHLRSGGPIQVPFRAGALSAYVAARDADPHGRWLMAAAWQEDPRPDHRTVWVSADRWDRVVGAFFAGTSAAGVSRHVARLAGQDAVRVFRSATLDLRIAGLAPGAVRHLPDDPTEPGRRAKLGMPRYFVHYVDQSDLQVDTSGYIDANGWAHVKTPRCRLGCSLRGVGVQGIPPFTVTQVRAGDQSFLSSPVRHTGRERYDPGPSPSGLQQVVPLAAGSPQRVVTAGGISLDDHLESLDATRAAVQVVGTSGALPLIGRAGSLLDLDRALIRTRGTVVAVTSVVIARADTPASVLARLRADGGGRPTTYAEVADRLDRTPQARADRLALLVAIGVALVALTHLLAWLASQVSRRRLEVAGLRAAGNRPRAVRRAYVVEASLLALVVLVTAAVVAVATTVPLLTPIDLVGGWPEAPALHLRVRPVTLAAVLSATASVTAVVCTIVFTRFGRSARPAALRSADR